MCFSFDAVVPDIPAALRRPPIAGGAAAELLTLTSQDGTAFSAALARVDGPAPAGVVILPDVRGLFRFYVQLAERFAQAGVPAVALDYFGRTAGLGPREEDFEFGPHVEQTREATVRADAEAAAAHLRSETGVERVVSVGFCFGGAHSFLLAGDDAFDGAVGFYGVLAGREPRLPSVIDRAGALPGPILGLFAGDDHAIPVSDVEAFDAALTGEHEVKVYDGAPHSFFDRRADAYAGEAADAWERILGFLGLGRAATVG